MKGSSATLVLLHRSLFLSTSDILVFGKFDERIPLITIERPLRFIPLPIVSSFLQQLMMYRFLTPINSALEPSDEVTGIWKMCRPFCMSNEEGWSSSISAALQNYQKELGFGHVDDKKELFQVGTPVLLFYEEGHKSTSRLIQPTREDCYGFLVIYLRSTHYYGRADIGDHTFDCGGTIARALDNHYAIFPKKMDYHQYPIKAGEKSCLVYEIIGTELLTRLSNSELTSRVAALLEWKKDVTSGAQFTLILSEKEREEEFEPDEENLLDLLSLPKDRDTYNILYDVVKKYNQVNTDKIQVELAQLSYVAQSNQWQVDWNFPLIRQITPDNPLFDYYIDYYAHPENLEYIPSRKQLDEILGCFPFSTTIHKLCFLVTSLHKLDIEASTIPSILDDAEMEAYDPDEETKKEIFNKMNRKLSQVPDDNEELDLMRGVSILMCNTVADLKAMLLERAELGISLHLSCDNMYQILNRFGEHEVLFSDFLDVAECGDGFTTVDLLYSFAVFIEFLELVIKSFSTVTLREMLSEMCEIAVELFCNISPEQSLRKPAPLDRIIKALVIINPECMVDNIKQVVDYSTVLLQIRFHIDTATMVIDDYGFNEPIAAFIECIVEEDLVASINSHSGIRSWRVSARASVFDWMFSTLLSRDCRLFLDKLPILFLIREAQTNKPALSAFFHNCRYFPFTLDRYMNVRTMTSAFSWTGMWHSSVKKMLRGHTVTLDKIISDMMESCSLVGRDINFVYTLSVKKKYFVEVTCAGIVDALTKISPLVCDSETIFKLFQCVYFSGRFQLMWDLLRICASPHIFFYSFILEVLQKLETWLKPDNPRRVVPFLCLWKIAIRGILSRKRIASYPPSIRLDCRCEHCSEFNEFIGMNVSTFRSYGGQHVEDMVHASYERLFIIVKRSLGKIFFRKTVHFLNLIQSDGIIKTLQHKAHTMVREMKKIKSERLNFITIVDALLKQKEFTIGYQIDDTMDM